MKMAEQKDIGLAALLAQVRLEIDRAQDNLRKSNKAAALDWESAEIEVSFGIKKEVEGKGGVEFYVFAIEAGGSYKSEEVHRLTLKLKPSPGSAVAIAGGRKRK
jgi:Trypsin-co-occurring domain 2